MIKVSGVTKHFDDFKVLDDIYLEVPKAPYMVWLVQMVREKQLF